MRKYFLIFGLINFIALLVAFLLSLNVIIEYFSYFTVLSNILITAVFIYIGITPDKKNKKSHLFHKVYGPAVLYMCITGIVYWTILHGGKQLTTDVEWITLVLHGFMPIAVVIGWIIFPPRPNYSWKVVFTWLIFPSIFVIYTLTRGLFVNWYPYPFLNPNIGGYNGVAIWTIGILTGAFIVGQILRWISKIILPK